MTENDAIQARITGKVGRVTPGSRFVVEVHRPNMQYPDRVTVWSRDAAVNEGDRVVVSGLLSWKKTERNDKVYVDVSINQPRLENHEPASAEFGYGDEKPF